MVWVLTEWCSDLLVMVEFGLDLNQHIQEFLDGLALAESSVGLRHLPQLVVGKPFDLPRLLPKRLRRDEVSLVQQGKEVHQPPTFFDFAKDRRYAGVVAVGFGDEEELVVLVVGVVIGTEVS